MNIIHITSPGFRTAGKLVFDIHSGLITKGHNSFVICKAEINNIDHAFSYYNKKISNFRIIKNKILRKFNKIFFLNSNLIANNDFLDYKENRNQLRYHDIVEKFPFKPDVIILYALQEFINVKTINNIYQKTGARIYWLMYDTAPLTGGCHYSWDCTGYINTCGNCPQLSSNISNDITQKNYNFKKKYLHNIDITLLVPTEWLLQKAMKSSLFRNKSKVKWIIPINDEFNYMETDLAKEQLNLAKNKKYLLFGAVKTTNERKGLKYLIEAFNIMKNKSMTLTNFEILLLGKQEDINSLNIPYHINMIGFIKDRDTLIKYYQAAHVVVVPSIEDAGPLMISEAIACGTPIVSFEMGSAFDLVHNGITGYRAKLKNSYDMAKGISEILNMKSEDYNIMSQNCLEISKDKLNITGQINKLVEIISE